jgi:type 2A phosphatase activator TIP41
VGPSEAWRAARKEAPAHECQQPFDWTFTSTYQGTLGARTRIEKAGPGEDVNFERLKQPDPIVFYDEICLYEDELADNGCAQVFYFH